MANRSRLLILLAAAALAPGCTQNLGEVAAAPQHPVQGGAVRPEGPTIPVAIATAAGEQHYRAEVARTMEEQALGLMYRTALPERGGMIFPMSPPRPASFWMKNTRIPLDIIFIRPDRTIAMIAARTRPESLDPVGPGEEPIAAVLELDGGQAARDGVKVGDRVSWQD